MRHAVEEIAVMADDYHGAAAAQQKVLQPGAPLDRLGLVLSAVDLVRQFQSERGKTESKPGRPRSRFWEYEFWRGVDLLVISQCAIRVSAYFTALLYAEFWYESQQVDESHKDFTKFQETLRDPLYGYGFILFFRKTIREYAYIRTSDLAGKGDKSLCFFKIFLPLLSRWQMHIRR